MSNEIISTAYAQGIPSAASKEGFISDKNVFIQIRNPEPVFHIPITKGLSLEKTEILRDSGEIETMYVCNEFEMIPILIVATFVQEQQQSKNLLTGLYINGKNQNIPRYVSDGAKTVSHVRIFGRVKPKACKDFFLASVIGRGKGQTQNLNKMMLAHSITATTDKKMFFGDTLVRFNTAKKPSIVQNGDGTKQSQVFLVDSKLIPTSKQALDFDVAKAFEMSKIWATNLLNNYETIL